jgi:hypothetical protein
MAVDDAASEAIQECRAQKPHETGGDYQIRRVRGNRLRERRIPRSPIRMPGHLHDERRQLTFLSLAQPAGTRPISADSDDLGGVVGTGRVQQSL